MKKKLISVLLCLGLIANCMVFAEDIPEAEPETIPEEVVSVEEVEEASEEVAEDEQETAEAAEDAAEETVSAIPGYYALLKAGTEIYADKACDEKIGTIENACVVYVTEGTAVLYSADGEVKAGYVAAAPSAMVEDKLEAYFNRASEAEEQTVVSDTDIVLLDVSFEAAEEAAEKVSIAITTQPKSVTVASAGDTAKFTVAATGEGLSYQWYYKAASATTWTACGSNSNTYSIAVTAGRSGRQLYCKITDANGHSVDTNAVAMKVAGSAVQITTQPTNAVVTAAGNTATFKVVASGTGLTYKWYYKAPTATTWTATSATAATYSIAVTAARNGRQMKCVITDANGNTDETVPVSMSICAKITAQPSDCAVTAAGKTASFSVTAAGDGLTYQWYYRASETAAWAACGSNANTYSIAVTAARDGRQLKCAITDTYGNFVETKTVAMSIATAVKITGQPADVCGAIGATAKFTVTATGTGLTYQWYYKAPTATAWSTCGSNSNVYSIGITAGRDGRQFKCKVSDALGNSVESNVVSLTVDKVKITAQPSDVCVAVGATAAFTVTATGTGLTYQWYYKAPTATTWSTCGSNSSTYSISATAARDGRQFKCKVTDTYGNSVESDVATLTLDVVKITVQPVNTSVATAGQTATFEITATGAGLTYQWYYKAPTATAWSTCGSNSNTYSISVTAARSGRQFKCVVTNANGSTVESDVVSATICAQIVTAPVDAYVAKAGDTAKFTVAAEGDGLTYKWYYRTSETAAWTATSSTSATYSIAVTAGRNGRQMKCVITDSYNNTIETEPATMAIAEETVITTQPEHVVAEAVGDTVELSVEATGTALTYQWYYKLAGTSTYAKYDCTTPVLEVKTTAELAGAVFYCAITNGAGTVTETNRARTIVCGYDFVSGSFIYNFDTEGGVTVVKYNGTAASVTVPSIYANRPITAIGESAFEGNTTLTSIDLPDTVQVIGKRAFADCTSLSSMT